MATKTKDCTTTDYETIPYTMEIDWDNGTVWLNNHISKEKMVVTHKDMKSIVNSFLLIEAKQLGKI